MLAAFLLALQPTPALDVFGDWRIPPETEGGPTRGIVRIAPDTDPDNEIEDGTPVGTIHRVGAAYADDPGAEDVLGLRIVWGFTPDGDRWKGGRILDPEAGKTYRANIRRNGDALAVEGCVAFICRGQVWTRVPE